jgi:ferrochelatase
MRFAEPSIQAGLARLRDAGATRVAAIILSPQYSPLLMGGYELAVAAARGALGARAPDVDVAGAWHLEPAFVEALASRVIQALAFQRGSSGRPAHVLLTAHSVPRTVAEGEPDYVDQLARTASAVAECAGLGPDAWTFCWQSAGHAPGEWMRPDLEDVIADVAADGGDAVVVAPVQFLADHLEVLYDLDVAAAAQARAVGVAFRRVASLNADPGLIAALSAVARRTLSLC